MKKTLIIVLTILFTLSNVFFVGAGCSGKSTDENGIVYVKVWGGYAVADGSNFKGSELLIPSGYKGKPVVEISPKAFDHCLSLCSVEILDNVKKIGYGAFNWCSSLNRVKLGNGVTSIGDEAFLCCDFSVIKLPDSVKSIGKSAFFGCSWLTSLEIPNGVEIISSQLCVGCALLKSVVLPSSVRRIDERAFHGCGSLEEIIFEGTTAQWNKIKKGEDWSGYIATTSVTCSDGIVNI